MAVVLSHTVMLDLGMNLGWYSCFNTKYMYLFSFALWVLINNGATSTTTF